MGGVRKEAPYHYSNLGLLTWEGAPTPALSSKSESGSNPLCAQLDQAETHQWREPASHHQRKPIPQPLLPTHGGKVWTGDRDSFWRPLLSSLPTSLKCCREGSFLLPGAFDVTGLCTLHAKGIKRAAPLPLVGKPAAVPRYSKEIDGGCPAQSLIRHFFQLVTWLKLGSHLRSTPPPTLCKLEYKSEKKAFLCLNKLL